MSTNFDKYHKFLNREGKLTSDDEMMAFLSKSEEVSVEPSNNKQDIWDAIDEATNDKASSKRPLLYSIAAVISLLIISIYFIAKTDAPIIDQSYKTALAEKTDILLPDGSEVVLNADSKLSYSNETNRVVTLDGEAFFEVKKGERFVVKTGNGLVEVLGTSFNVYSRGEEFNVVCKTGKVKVTSFRDNTEIILVPGEAAIEGQKETIEIEEIAGWIKGEFFFEERDVMEVFDEISKQFDVTITVSPALNRKFTGYFMTDNLDDALASVCLPLDLKYEVEGKTIRIFKKQ